jgi:hypothetical protein
LVDIPNNDFHPAVTLPSCCCLVITDGICFSESPYGYARPVNSAADQGICHRLCPLAGQFLIDSGASPTIRISIDIKIGIRYLLVHNPGSTPQDSVGFRPDGRFAIVEQDIPEIGGYLADYFLFRATLGGSWAGFVGTKILVVRNTVIVAIGAALQLGHAFDIGTFIKVIGNVVSVGIRAPMELWQAGYGLTGVFLIIDAVAVYIRDRAPLVTLHSGNRLAGILFIV